IVQERDIQLEHLDEFHQSAIGDVELAVEVKRARIAVGPEFGNLAIIDVARKLGRVLVLFVLRLEGADADTVLFRKNEAEDLDLVDHPAPVSVVLREALVVRVSAKRAKLALD